MAECEAIRILFIHKNYPAQFGRLAIWLARRGWDVTFATTRDDVRSDTLRIVRFADHRDPTPNVHGYLLGTEQAVISGQGLARTAVALRKRGYVPDIVVAHSGWGVGFFVKDVWPEARYVQYAEWYYTFPPADRTPYAIATNPIDERARARIRNAPFWLDFSAADATICPTRYQASRFPKKLARKITVLHDGFDTTRHAPGPRDDAFLTGLGIPPGAEILTYIARGMEPTRGFPELMKAIARLQTSRPDLHAVIIADDRVAYGPRLQGPSWKTRMLDALDLDQTRLHFTGLVPRGTMIKALQASDAHLYLSAPFVLSWSFLEAMSCGCPLVAARSAPVEEFMEDNREGLLVDPFNTEEVSDAVSRLIDDRALARRLGAAARHRIVTRHDADSIAFPAHAQFYTDLVADRLAGSHDAAPAVAPKPPDTPRQAS